MYFRSLAFSFALAIWTMVLPMQCASQESVEGTINVTDSLADQEPVQPTPDFPPALTSIETAIRDFIRHESVEDSQLATEQAAENLEAQRELARWSADVAYAAIASAVFTLFGLLLIWRTLEVSYKTLTTTQGMARDTTRIGEAQVSAYLQVTSIDAHLTGTSDARRFSSLFSRVSLINLGNTGATEMTCETELSLEANGIAPIIIRTIYIGQESLSSRETSVFAADPVEGVRLSEITNDNIDSMNIGFQAKISYKDIFENQKVLNGAWTGEYTVLRDANRELSNVGRNESFSLTMISKGQRTKTLKENECIG